MHIFVNRLGLETFLLQSYISSSETQGNNYSTKVPPEPFHPPSIQMHQRKEGQKVRCKPVEGLYYPVYLSAHIKWPETYELLEALSDTQPYQAPTPTLLRMSARLLPPEDSTRGMQMPNVIGQKTVEVRSRKPKL